MRIFFGRRYFYIFEVFIKGIARIIQFFDKLRFVFFGIYIKGSSQNNELYLVRLMTGKRQRK